MTDIAQSMHTSPAKLTAIVGQHISAGTRQHGNASD
jgi:hypothetical protein